MEVLISSVSLAFMSRASRAGIWSPCCSSGAISRECPFGFWGSDGFGVSLKGSHRGVFMGSFPHSLLRTSKYHMVLPNEQASHVWVELEKGPEPQEGTAVKLKKHVPRSIDACLPRGPVSVQGKPSRSQNGVVPQFRAESHGCTQSKTWFLGVAPGRHSRG